MYGLGRNQRQAGGPTAHNTATIVVNRKIVRKRSCMANYRPHRPHKLSSSFWPHQTHSCRLILALARRSQSSAFTPSRNSAAAAPQQGTKIHHGRPKVKTPTRPPAKSVNSIHKRISSRILLIVPTHASVDIHELTPGWT